MNSIKKKLVHCKKTLEWDVYIGRGNSIYGNLWSHLDDTLAAFKVSTREEAVSNYDKWLRGTDFKDVFQEKRKQILDSLPNLKGKILACWCFPKLCHGEILLKLIDELEANAKNTS